MGGKLKMKEIYESNTHIPISKIGTGQIVDIEKSSGIKCYNEYFRVCTVLKGVNNSLSNNKDRSPYRIAELFGGSYLKYNNHIIFQTPTCPYNCPYCYVDRLENDIQLTPKEIVSEFLKLRSRVKEPINVLHMMGGDPAIYSKFWPLLRKELDNANISDVILLSDSLCIENTYYNIKPWNYISLNNFVLVCGIKGSSTHIPFVINDILSNGGNTDFLLSLSEALYYVNKKNCYFTLIDYGEQDLNLIYDVIPKDKLDLLSIFLYEVTKRKLIEYLY